MGISEGLDCDDVDRIVWVRRRNGSWWPGRVLGPNDVSDSQSRSGTPVKLLGREDASVDWYNLEKSKRIKAFRCGEFDDCIERAESLQGNPIKKREKYARREDAILHALELEKQHLERKQQKLGIPLNCMSNKILGISKKEPDSSPSLEEEVMGDPLYTQKGKHAKKPIWEDDNSEAIPRMRGLQDFGLRIAPSKRKLSTTVGYENSRRSDSIDNYVHALSNGVGANHVNSSKSSLAIKRKRSKGGPTEESLLKRRDRLRPLVQVLQSSTKLPACQSLQSDVDAAPIFMQGEEEKVGVICRAKRSRCVYLPDESNDCLNHTGFPSDQMQISPSHFGTNNCLNTVSLIEQNTCSGLVEEEESDSSERDYLVHDMEEEAIVLSDPTQIPAVPGQRNSAGYVRCGGSDLDECAHSGYMSHTHPNNQTSGISADMGVSKWQLKGKRNIRNLSKRPLEALDGKSTGIEADNCNGSIHGTFSKGKINILKTARMVIPSQRASGKGFCHRSEELNYAYDEGVLIDNDLTQTQMLGFGNRKYPLMLNSYSRERRKSNDNITDSDEDSLAISPHWEESDECFDPIYVGQLSNRLESMLVDVDLKVQASYQGEHVPLVSLMSRLNGKAIIGHPIQIEALQDASSDVLLSTNGFSEEIADDDGNPALSPVWRTGKRTVTQWVPHPHPASTKSYDSHSNDKVRLMKKSVSQIRRPLNEKFPKKPLKKLSLSGQKTRTLSSIATEQVCGKYTDHKSATLNGDLDGWGKPEKTAPSITCIPVKLVFSRILEVVGRLPSKADSQGFDNYSSERKPS
ncbi:uncharacterized protein At1g51745-like [Tasmannia lanceolata]|uniref:uncharacterized protein At1g51745-like n=1 Tax=Tasmannia lanceolata TaxID=3420 RepID=UPI0040638249